MLPRTQNRELFILRLSTAVTVLFAVSTVTVAILSDSMTLMLNGLYGVADVTVSIIAIIVVEKIYLPPTRKYHYGYAKFEPVMTALQGILIITICAGSIVASLQDIVNPDPIAHSQLTVYFSLASFLVCVGLGLYVRKAAKSQRSEILVAAADLWFIEGTISVAVFAACLLNDLWIRKIGANLTGYVDPALCIVFSLALIFKPLRILKESFLDLVDASPQGSILVEIETLAERYKEKYHLAEVEKTRIRKAGRYLFVFISFKADHRKILREMHEITENLTTDIAKIRPHADVAISFREHRVHAETP
jgi:cation diffusion facilitator family transporter